MSIDAHPKDRLGDHVVMTITEPVYWLVLRHHGKDVRIGMSRVREFARLYDEDPSVHRWVMNRFEWVQDRALVEAGYAHVMSNGNLWPSKQLVDDLALWVDRRM